MKGLFFAAVLALAFCFAGADTANAQCANGSCRVGPVRSVTRAVVTAPVRVTRGVIARQPVRSVVRGVVARQPVRSTVRRVVRWRPFARVRACRSCRR